MATEVDPSLLTNGAHRRPRARSPGRSVVPLPPDSIGYRLKRKLLGPPLHSDELEHQRLGKPTALAVFASDNLSSSAYATEEILHVLVPAVGLLAFSLVMPITIALLVMLGLLILSYRETIKAYPVGGRRLPGHPRQLRHRARPRSPAPPCSSATSSRCRCPSSAGTAALISSFDALEPATGCRSRSPSSPS